MSRYRFSPLLAAAAGVIALMAAPLVAEAHRAWMAPSSTVLSGSDAWVGVDAGMSNGVFIADHAAMRLDGLTILGPDGQLLEPENMMRGRYRSTFDVHLTKQGTYRIANVMGGVVASYTLNASDGAALRPSIRRACRRVPARSRPACRPCASRPSSPWATCPTTSSPRPATGWRWCP